MFDNIPRETILCFDKYFNDLIEMVRADIKDFNHPRKCPVNKNTVRGEAKNVLIDIRWLSEREKIENLSETANTPQNK